MESLLDQVGPSGGGHSKSSYHFSWGSICPAGEEPYPFSKQTQHAYSLPGRSEVSEVSGELCLLIGSPQCFHTHVGYKSVPGCPSIQVTSKGTVFQLVQLWRQGPQVDIYIIHLNFSSRTHDDANKLNV